MKANVYVTLKEDVLDPQGDAIRRAMTSLGFADVRSVRAGKLIEIETDTTDRAAFERDLDAICRKLLANPVIETFRYEILGTGSV